MISGSGADCWIDDYKHAFSWAGWRGDKEVPSVDVPSWGIPTRPPPWYVPTPKGWPASTLAPCRPPAQLHGWQGKSRPDIPEWSDGYGTGLGTTPWNGYVPQDRFSKMRKVKEQLKEQIQKKIALFLWYTSKNVPAANSGVEFSLL